MSRPLTIAVLAVAASAFGGRVLAGQTVIAATTSGTIHGQVVDATGGSPLAMAEVSVEGTGARELTDLNGRYQLSGVPAGMHTLTVRLIGYAAKAVTGVRLAGGQSVRVDVTLATAAIALEAIEVTAELERGSAVALIEERRGATVVTDAIGSEQIARSPDSDAAQALKRVTGLSVIGGRYVYVRGLGDRYSAARLNGAPVPSPEPDRKALPLDMVPSHLLQAVVTSKTYSPDQPGDYAGGLVDIQTKEFPGQRSLRLSVGTSYNSETTLRAGFGYPGGRLDFLGIDDGARGLPAAVPADVKVTSSDLSPTRIEEIGEAFSNVWQPRDRTVPVNTNASLAYADQTRVFGKDLGFLAAATYANGYTTADAIERIIVVADQAEEPETDYSGTLTERNVRWSAMGKLDLLLTRNGQLTARSLYSRTADDVARTLAGFNRDRNTKLQNYRLRFTSRAVWSNNLEGKHFLPGLGGTRVEWRLGYSRATLDEPDRREVVYDETADGRYAWRELTNSGTRYFTELADRDVSGALDLIFSLPVGNAQLKVGGLILEKDRDFFSRRFRFRADGPLGDRAFLPPDSLFAPANIGAGLLQIQEDTRRTDNYDASQSTRAGYVMVDLPLGSQLRLTGGARLERVTQKVTPFDLFPLGLPPVDSADIRNTDLLPGVNLTWSPRADMNVRAAFSQTVARPEFREQAPFDFVDFAGGFLQVGNPTLTRTLIRNYDLRWEWFPALGNLVAVSGFYKSFEDPIEAVVFPSSELIATWDNNDAADVYGAEFELRTSLGFLASTLSNFTLGGNLTVVHSAVQTGDSLHLPGGNTVAVEPRERALQGQSPYVINGSLTYFQPTWGTTLTVLYNRFGERIDKVGTQVLPDVFEQPRDQLDLVLEQRVSAGLALKLAGTNLLDEAAEFRQAGQLVRYLESGRTLSVSISVGTGGS
jgi:hypothetical protein